MADRAATAVKSKPKSKSRIGAKASTQVKTVKPKTISTPTGTDTAETPPKPRRRAKVETRTRIYWAVFNQDCKRMAVFEFGQKAEAEKRAERLFQSTGERHFIQKIKAVVRV